MMDMAFNMTNFCEITRQSHVLIGYKGPITDIIMAEISRDIRAKFADNQKVSRKMFAIFIELAQNILYYSAEKVFEDGISHSIGAILITQTEDDYIFSCGNMIETEHVQEMDQHCAIINSLSKDDLRIYKREQRNKPSNARSKGAGIGLIHVAITSENLLEFDFKESDPKFSYFSLSVKVSKQ